MTVTTDEDMSSRINQILAETKQLTKTEQLVLARLVLDSVLVDVDQADAEANWSAMGLEAFQKDWDNPEDAIYDDWREHYDVSTR